MQACLLSVARTGAVELFTLKKASGDVREIRGRGARIAGSCSVL